MSGARFRRFSSRFVGISRQESVPRGRLENRRAGFESLSTHQIPAKNASDDAGRPLTMAEPIVKAATIRGTRPSPRRRAGR